jgi:hypothetical protein
MNQPKSLDELIAKTKAAIASGELSSEQRAEFEAECKAINDMPRDERDSIDYFLRHMPDADSDLALIVLKGHLLLEQRIREFISERMLTPSALDDARLSSYQLICLAEALTLPNDDPKRLWTVLRKLNTLRNQLAHNLTPQRVQERVQEIVNEYSATWPVQSGFVGVLGNAYGQLSELCRLAREPSFRVRGRGASQ